MDLSVDRNDDLGMNKELSTPVPRPKGIIHMQFTFSVESIGDDVHTDLEDVRIRAIAVDEARPLAMVISPSPDWMRRRRAEAERSVAALIATWEDTEPIASAAWLSRLIEEDHR